MKIIDIRESTRPIQSSIRNAYIDFSKMTLSPGPVNAIYANANGVKTAPIKARDDAQTGRLR